MSQETPTFYLGLTMAGAVSAGCYTAGVMDYLFEILDLWERAKKGEVEGISEDLIPQYNVVIDAMGGASAGGMATIMAAIYALEGNIKPVKEVPKDPMASQNLLYDSWVHLVDEQGNGQKSFEQIWNTDDLEGTDSRIQSVFNSRFIDKIADRTLDFENGRTLEEQVKKLPPYISKNLEILLSHTLLRGIPLAVKFQTDIGDKGYEAPTHTSYEHFLLSHFKLNEGEAVNEDEGFLWLNPYEKEHKEKMKLSTKSTGAFPIGLQFRDFDPEQFSNGYYESVAKRIIYGEFGTQNSHSEEELELKLPPDFESITIDGGAINNEPYREVASILYRHNQEGETFQNYGLIMIDPFPDVYEKEKDNYKEDKPKDLVDVVPAIINTLWDQSKIKRKEMIEQFSKDYVHAEIYPVRNYLDGAGKKQTKDHPIASGSFAAFSGFLDINFRVHDFFLGRDNARNFVRYFFSLPYYENEPEKNHPIHRNWTAASIRKYKIRKDKQTYLPIIPDMNIALKNLPWAGDELGVYTVKEIPKYNPKPLFDLEAKMNKRFEKLFTLMASRFSATGGNEKSPLTEEWLAQKNRKGWLGRVSEKAFGFATRGVKRYTKKVVMKKGIKWLSSVVADHTIQMILKDLEAKGFLEKK